MCIHTHPHAIHTYPQAVILLSPTRHTHTYPQAVILYAFIVSVHSLKARGKALGPYAWQIRGAKPSQKGSCFCE